jgi:hypothetical protein
MLRPRAPLRQIIAESNNRCQTACAGHGGNVIDFGVDHRLEYDTSKDCSTRDTL